MKTKIWLLSFLLSITGCTGNKSKNYSSLDDAATDKIGVLLGSEQDRFITQTYPKAKIVHINMATDLISAIKAGTCDVIILTSIQAEEIVKAQPELKILQRDVCSCPLGVGFSKSDTTLKKAFNLFLDGIKKDGSYEQIVERWTTNQPSVQMPEIALPTTGTPIRIGTTATSSPYSFEKDGKLSGLDIELVTRFAAQMNRPIEFSKMDFSGLIPALIAGKVDIIANYIMITPERAREVDFSDAYLESRSAAMVMKKDMAPVTGYRTINDLSEKRIGVLLGSTQDTYVTKQFPEATIVRVDAMTDLKLALKGNKCDVIALDEAIYTSMYDGDTDVCILDNELYESEIAVGFNLENTVLRDEFNKMLEEMRNDGTYDQIYDRWVKQPHPAMPALEMQKTGTPLRVGVSSSGAPCDYYENGENVGFDNELVRRFAHRLGRPIEFQIINFGGLIAAISAGKVDIIASGIMITEERAKKVAFADSHYSGITISAILRKNLASTANPTGKGYKSVDDLRTKRIAALTGTTHDAFVTKNFPDATIIRCDTYSDALMALTSKKCDATMFSKVSYNHLKQSNPQVVMLDSMVHCENSGMGFSYKQDELKEQFNTFLREIRASKLYDEIYSRWIDNCDSTRMPIIETPTSGTPIRVGLSGASIPFTFIHNGEHAGIDVELLRRFAVYINRPIEFSIINFGGLISALTSGKVDIVTDMSITEERAKQVNFSDPYFINYAVMLVLDKNLATNNTATSQPVEKQGFFTSVADSFHNNLIAEKRYILILKGLWQTLLISVFAALLGTILGGLVCFMRMSKKTILNTIAKTYITLMRGIPVLVLLMLFYYAIFAKWDISATIVAIITFAMNFAAYVSEMFRTSIQGVDRGQAEAGIAMGFSKIKTFIFIVMPQAIKSVLPVYKGELISLIKMTSIVGYIAVEDLTKASDIIRSRTFDAFFPLIMVAIIYFLLAWGFTAALDSINKKLTSR